MVVKGVCTIAQDTRLLSLDTSSSKTGWAYFENAVYKKSGVINLDTKECRKKYKDKCDARIRDMCLSVVMLLKEYEPDIIVIEKLNVGRNMNATRILAKIMGVVYGYSLFNNCYYYEISPSQWRGQLGMQLKGRKREEYKQLSVAYVKNVFGKEVNDDESDSICAGIGYIKMFT